MAAGFSFSYSPAGAQAPLLEVDPNGQASSPYGAFSIQAISNKLAGVQQGTVSTGRVQEPGLTKGAPVPTPWAWLKARPLVMVAGLAALAALVWIVKRRKKG